MKLFGYDLLNVVTAVLVLIIIDVLLGIIQSVKEHTFDVRKLPQFLETMVLPYGGSLIVLLLGASFSDGVKGMLVAAAGAVTAKVLTEIKDKLVTVFGFSLPK